MITIEFEGERLSERVDIHLILSLADYCIGEGEYLGTVRKRNPLWIRDTRGQSRYRYAYAWVADISGMLLGFEADDPAGRPFTLNRRVNRLVGDDWTFTWTFQDNTQSNGDAFYHGRLGFVVDPTIHGDLDAWKRQMTMLRVFHDTTKRFGVSAAAFHPPGAHILRSTPQQVWHKP